MSQVYFIYAKAVNLIKIGRSADPERRLDELRLLSPVDLEVIGLVDGGSRTEAELHQRFAKYRSHGEWFHAAKEIKTFAWRETMLCLWGKGTEDDHAWARDYMDKPIMDARHG